MILAPAIMSAEADPKVAAAKCFQEVGLDPDSYRIGHTKARNKTAYPLFKPLYIASKKPTLI